MSKLYLIEYIPTFVDGFEPNTKVINNEEEASDIIKGWRSGKRRNNDIPPKGHVVSQRYVFANNKIVVALIHYYEE